MPALAPQLNQHWCTGSPPRGSCLPVRSGAPTSNLALLGVVWRKGGDGRSTPRWGTRWKGHTFSAFLAMIKCSICSYQLELLIETPSVSPVHHSLETGRGSVLAQGASSGVRGLPRPPRDAPPPPFSLPLSSFLLFSPLMPSAAVLRILRLYPLPFAEISNVVQRQTGMVACFGEA